MASRRIDYQTTSTLNKYIPGFESLDVKVREPQMFVCRAVVNGQGYNFTVSEREMRNTRNTEEAYTQRWAARILDAMASLTDGVEWPLDE